MTFTVAELAKALGGTLWGDGSLVVAGAAEPDEAGADHIAIATAAKYAEKLRPGGIALLAEGMNPETHGLLAAILLKRPRLALAGLTRRLDPAPEPAPGIHPMTVIDDSAVIGEGAAIGPFVTIGARVRIGARARIASHVSIGDRSVIGDDALIHAGARIAHDVIIGDRFILHPNASIRRTGFPLSRPNLRGSRKSAQSLGLRGDIKAQHWTRIHSLGGVEIGDDVEVGALAGIDRGTIRATRIGRGTKIDNQVQIGHNVILGEDCMLCGQAGVAGSTRIGNRVVLGGKVGVSDNIFVGDDVIAGGGTEIYTNVPAGRVILGSPAVKMETHVEIQKGIRRLPRLYAQVAQLQETVKKMLDKGRPGRTRRRG
ncbi:UDP-3-O-(3-hydroxymyristoyl)glucosamine N-acyltransferase [Paracoccus sp. DMF-8]|uniref:UDP-3-O-(3-hydroxymyristoyl)glucosamine N-acyltransferase n=1 Tax=Paracoccus sp. DMF-8 TaxID=3019445 RepID=UPI0023E76BB5|nr:UDP-3-O-(3-hydroxymyristoyl)glucosamine N-acyltransferase [Paracoccus sp. DMF-8]MDF3606595.1 UDP-3-O-(3-hydroxymyristoyl)glucosamine N-acyltransferase [Paracoccus sp. DMF-8]